MAPKNAVKQHLADEILLQIFSNHQLPPAATIGQQRYETINMPQGPLLHDLRIKLYVDNELGIGACTHQHGEWKALLATLSAVAKASKRFRRIAEPLLYRVYPGQTLVSPELFLRTVRKRGELAGFVEEMVVDPWECMSSPKSLAGLVKQYGLSYDLIDSLKDEAKTWRDEAYAMLLLLYCSKVEVLDLIVPGAHGKDPAISALFEQMRRHGPNTLARNNEQAAERKNGPADLPLRKLRELHIHHAEHIYVRSISALEPLMRLPTVQSLTAYGFWNDAKSLVHLRHLQELTLWRCSFDSAPLLNAMKGWTELHSLSIVFAGCRPVLDRLTKVEDHPNFKQLGDIIRSKLKKLRKLRLDDREVDVLEPRSLGSFKNGPALEELAVNESCLGSYRPDQTLSASVSADIANTTLPLEELLPSTLRSLTIFRADNWWYEAKRGPQSDAFSKEGLAYRFDAIHDKVFELIRTGSSRLAKLDTIHIDTPQEFGRDVGMLGWKSQRVLGDGKLSKPSIVLNSMFTPEQKREWIETQEARESTPSVLLSRL